jgi:hypothetical protein
MGSTVWKGDRLISGYKCYIGGKEVQLINRVSASQVPSSANAMLVDDLADLENVPTPAIKDPVSAFVAPTSFYGAPAKPKKLQGPLYASCSLS